MKTFTTLMIGPALLLLVALPVSAETELIISDGHLMSAPLSRPCESPIDLCSHSSLSGPFLDSYFFTAETVLPSQVNPDVIVVVGSSVIKPAKGQGRGVIFSMDTVWLNTLTGEAIHLWEIIGGKGRRFKRASGSMSASALVTDITEGDYIAQIEVRARPE